MAKQTKQNNLLLQLALLVLIVFLGFFILQNYQNKKEPEKPMVCGGFIGAICPKGYTCKMEDNYPDAQGKCVKSFFIFN